MNVKVHAACGNRLWKPICGLKESSKWIFSWMKSKATCKNCIKACNK